MWPLGLLEEGPQSTTVLFAPARPSFSLANILFSRCSLFAFLKIRETRHLLQVLKGRLQGWSLMASSDLWISELRNCRGIRGPELSSGARRAHVSSLHVLDLIGHETLLFQGAIIKDGFLLC